MIYEELTHKQTYILMLKYKSMCGAAGDEISDQWGAHCTNEGYGPINLLDRLTGKRKPDYYLSYVTDKEADFIKKERG